MEDVSGVTSFEVTHYQPYFCEENIWWLNRHTKLAPFERRVVFITNPHRSVALASQKAGGPDGVVVWDYHVVLAVRQAAWMICDLDSTAGVVQPLNTWFQNSVGVFQNLPRHLIAGYRAVPGEIYSSAFSSDRRHMLDLSGNWRHPPPPWPTIGMGHKLEDFLDPSPGVYGPLMDATDLRKTLLRVDNIK